MLQTIIRNIVLCLLLGFSATITFGQEGNLKGYTIYKIAKHMAWPDGFEDTSTTFNFGFIGNDSTTQKIYNAFKFAEKFRKLEKKKIKAYFFEDIKDIKNIRVLYVNGGGKLDLNSIKTKISDRVTLLVTENYPFEEAMINLVADYKRGRFEVNKTNLRKAGLEPDGNVAFFSFKSEESISNTQDLLTLIKDGVDADLKAEDLVELLDEYTQMIDQIEAQKEEIIDQTAELRMLISEAQTKQKQIALQQLELEQKESEIELSQEELATISARNKKQQQQLAQTELELVGEMASLDSIHTLLAEKQSTFALELEKQEEMLRIKKGQIAENEYTIESQMNTIDVKEQQIETQQWLIWFGIIVLFGILGIVFLIYRNYRNKKKANAQLESKNKIIEEQKAIVEERNREVMDSINYAKRIQEAILPKASLVDKLLPEHFILYKPKDIVAGDFYWLEEVGKTVIFAAADCTGHGVPGAMVSVVCNNAMNRAVREFKLTVPGEILDKTRELVIEQFAEGNEDVKDGMDIALCSLEGNKLKYAGANNSLWVIRKGSEEVEEIKATKQPIGKVDVVAPFETHEIELNKDDSIYLFTDGYVDQFGGEKGKKFKSKTFKQLLISIQDGDLESQKSVIDESFEAWRGDLEQVDDVCVIGVRM
ncbi:MAG: serine phosphatase RsbU (regulator of sigma subunit) [Parvicellaceae bacterium]|jgi:serine phosphatase RsbU (regulator of sigma subunit)